MISAPATPRCSPLLSLRPERLKIARELIDPAPESAEHCAVLESIMQIANALDTEVVAEGIETEEHALICERIGVQVMQGFHFCRPLPESEAAAPHCRHHRKRRKGHPRRVTICSVDFGRDRSR